ncbi:hypothetical protein AVEN_223657-1 [Araneus ventricosus]|uniref:Uncharacterized protein n=1 Tax=Araneus ventricosus TaxID=182803 RepID=A0A4Y2JEU1_ARAVE|nr:hypothetical protein AVEN_223657-1 [Araneus ventricosus]
MTITSGRNCNANKEKNDVGKQAIVKAAQRKWRWIVPIAMKTGIIQWAFLYDDGSNLIWPSISSQDTCGRLVIKEKCGLSYLSKRLRNTCAN